MDFLTLLRVGVSLAVVLLVIWFLYKKVGRGATARKRTNPITVLSKQGVGQKASVALIEAEGKRFVLGVTEHGVTVLHTADAPEPAPVVSIQSAASHESFDEALADVDEATVTKAADTASPIAGSILSKRTWSQAFKAVGASLK